MHRTKTNTWQITLLAAASVLFTGCATTYRVHVDAVRNASLARDREYLSYRLVNANPERDSSDLTMVQAAFQVRTALSSKGLFEAPEGVAPDLVVEFDCDIDAPRQRVEEFISPVYAERPDKSGVRSQLSYELVGEKTTRVVVTVYEKFVRISAREAPGQSDDHPPREVWSVVATNVDERSDLDRYVLLLVAAAMDQINADSGGSQAIALRADDRRVTFVQRGL